MKNDTAMMGKRGGKAAGVGNDALTLPFLSLHRTHHKCLVNISNCELVLRCGEAFYLRHYHCIVNKKRKKQFVFASDFLHLIFLVLLVFVGQWR